MIGEPGNDNHTGAVHMYGRDVGGLGNWGLEQTLSTFDTEAGNAGAIHVFEREGTWIELARVDASDKDDVDWFGDQVGISGGTLVAGALADDDGGSNAGSAYIFQVVAGPEITVAGDCPGDLTLALSGATPSGPVVVAYSQDPGQTIVLSAPCGDIELELEEPRLLARFLVDGEGEQSLVTMAPAGSCGLHLQVVDQVTCGVGPVAQIP